MELLKTLSQAWKVEELRKKILFTLMMLVVYRIGSNIPVRELTEHTYHKCSLRDRSSGSFRSVFWWIVQ